MKAVRIFLIFVFAFSLVLAQGKEHGDKGKREKKIEQLEKLKLGEVLEMDENTSVKFFARRCEQKKKQKELMAKRDSLLEFLGKKVTEGASDKIYIELTSKVIEIEKRIFSER